MWTWLWIAYEKTEFIIYDFYGIYKCYKSVGLSSNVQNFVNSFKRLAGLIDKQYNLNLLTTTTNI